MSSSDDEQQIDTRSKPFAQKKRLRKIQESDSENEQASVAQQKGVPAEDDRTVEQLQAEIAELEAQAQLLDNDDENSEALPTKKKRDQKAVEKQTQGQKKVSKKIGELNESQINEIAEGLREKMKQAYLDDNKANQNKLPALNKLTALEQVCRELKKLSIQEAFIDSNGCTVLGHWLEPLPDGTYPNIAIVKEILNTINALAIDPEDLKISQNLKHIIKVYSSGETGMQGGVQQLARTIYDKWSRMVNNINTRYDERTTHEDQYRKFRQKQSKYEILKEDESTEQAQEVGGSSRGLGDGDIVRGRAGIILPRKNAFDFVDRPQPTYVTGENKKSDKSGAANVRKVMEALKRGNRASYTNKRLQIVKLD